MLNETNPYLRNKAKAREMLIISVASSTAIETGESVEAIARYLRSKIPARVTKARRSAR